jgi:hypothetical protein
MRLLAPLNDRQWFMQNPKRRYRLRHTTAQEDAAGGELRPGGGFPGCRDIESDSMLLDLWRRVEGAAARAATGYRRDGGGYLPITLASIRKYWADKYTRLTVK